MSRKFFSLALGAVALAVLGLAGSAFAADEIMIVEGCGRDGSCHKACHPVTEHKKVSKRVYGDICEDFCLPKCGLFGCLSGHSHCDEDGGDCAHGAKCGHVCTRKYLTVKVREHEECVTKCVVDQQGCSATVDQKACPAHAVSLQPVPMLPAPAPAPRATVPQRLSPNAHYEK